MYSIKMSAITGFLSARPRIDWFISSLTNESLHKLIDTTIRNLNCKEKRQLLKQCLSRINQSDNYPYKSDKSKIRKALMKNAAVKDAVCTYLALAVGLVFTGLLSSVFLIRIWDYAAVAYEEMTYIENAHLYTDTPCETIYSDTEKLLYDYPNLKLPEYIPDGYTFEHASVVTDPVSFNVSIAYFDENENLISLSLLKFKPEEYVGSFNIEADAGSYKTFVNDGVLYEQVTNYGRYTIVCEESPNEFYMLFGVDTEEDAHKIIFSTK